MIVAEYIGSDSLWHDVAVEMPINEKERERSFRALLVETTTSEADWRIVNREPDPRAA